MGALGWVDGWGWVRMGEGCQLGQLRSELNRASPSYWWRSIPAMRKLSMSWHLGGGGVAWWLRRCPSHGLMDFEAKNLGEVTLRKGVTSRSQAGNDGGHRHWVKGYRDVFGSWQIPKNLKENTRNWKHLKRILQVAVLHMSRQTAKGEVRRGYFDGNLQPQFNLLFLMVEKRWSFQHGWLKGLVGSFDCRLLLFSPALHLLPLLAK